MFTQSHVITFYTDDYDSCIVQLINMGFAPMMATAKKSVGHFKAFAGVYRFWSFETEDWTEDYNEVDICILAPDGFNTDWAGVRCWLKGESEELPLLKPVRHDAEDADVYDCRVAEELAHKQIDYKYTESVVNGIFYAEIIKPEIGQIDIAPYTIVIEDWEARKMIFMFSSICSVPSFGKE